MGALLKRPPVWFYKIFIRFSWYFLQRNGVTPVFKCKIAKQQLRRFITDPKTKCPCSLCSKHRESPASSRQVWLRGDRSVPTFPLSLTFWRPRPLRYWRPTSCSRHRRFSGLLDWWVFGSPVSAGCSGATAGGSGAGNRLRGRGCFGTILVGRKDGMD